MRSWKFVIIAIVCVCGLAYVFLRPTDENSGTTSATGGVAPIVMELARSDVTTVELTDMATEVRLAGSLTPIRRATLTARVAATINELPVQVGDVVKAGDLLVRFDKQALESLLTARKATVDAMNAQLQLAESVAARNANLGARGVASEATRLEADAQVLNLKAQLRSLVAEVADAERALTDAEVRAEFDGVIAARSVEQGQTVGVNTELMTVVDLSQMEVDAGVPTSRIPRVQLGQPVQLNVEGFAGRVFTGKVMRIAPTAVAGSRAVRVFLAISNDDGLLKGGMFTTGVLKVDERKGVIALPTVAVRKDEAGAFVLKVDNGILRRQAVTLGTSWSDRDVVEVSGVAPRDVVVSASLPTLNAGAKVTIEGM